MPPRLPAVAAPSFIKLLPPWVRPRGAVQQKTC